MHSKQLLFAAAATSWSVGRSSSRLHLSAVCTFLTVGGFSDDKFDCRADERRQWGVLADEHTRSVWCLEWACSLHSGSVCLAVFCFVS